MALLPGFNTSDRILSMMQSSWQGILNPFLANPVNNSLLLKGISLTTGDNVINTKLGRTLQGWIIADITAPATIYRSQPKNDLTLTLNSSANTTIDLVLF